MAIHLYTVVQTAVQCYSRDVFITTIALYEHNLVCRSIYVIFTLTAWGNMDVIHQSLISVSFRLH